ncbi:hypothetical protein DUI87_01254 [Hirundo rustica rustica]|uniref:Uncharacterized protein n=1 Tax=Hirundo rustica rustica TaxID=333673 RepID=A0A3M0L8X3_HIRRU|nr:hypothetical protein DUI87_01254 [Hirundo rustica rustica]
MPSRFVPLFHNLGTPRHREIIYDNTYVMEQRRLSEAYQQVQAGTRRTLASTLSIDFVDEVEYLIPTGKYGPPDGPRDILIIGDAINGPDGLQVIPEVQTVRP